MDQEILKKIKGLAFDVDGVMTTGGVFCSSNGDLLRTYDTKDSFGIRMANMRGIHTAVITGGWSESIKMRFLTTGVAEDDIHLHSRSKLKDFKAFCEKYGLDPSEVAYVGDDIPDISVIKACGLGVAPSDAVQEVKDAADFVSPFPGGKGCMRHLIESILKAQDKWFFDEDQYEKLF